MDDYISRQWLLTEYDKRHKGPPGGARKMIEEAPAADVRPVKQGEWLDHQEGRWVYAKCSECGTVHDVKSNFCPHCGADMTGGVNG